jgi:putative acetyltransferase
LSSGFDDAAAAVTERSDPALPPARADIACRRAAPSDAEGFVRLMSDPRAFAGLLQMPYPTAEQWHKRLEANASDSDSLHLVALHDGKVIGCAGLQAMGPSPRRRHVAGLGMAVAAEWQSRGVGTELLRRLLEWADNWIGYQRIELTVYTDNEPALRLYRRFGFEIEGRLRAFALRDGSYVDALAMARLHPRPPQLNEPARE